MFRIIILSELNKSLTGLHYSLVQINAIISILRLRHEKIRPEVGETLLMIVRSESACLEKLAEQ